MDNPANKSLRWSWRLSGASFVMAFVALHWEPLVVLIGTCSACIFGVVACVFARRAARQACAVALAGEPQPPPARLRRAVGLSAGAIVIGLALVLLFVNIFRISWVAMGWGIRLGALAREMQVYVADHGAYPTSAGLLDEGSEAVGSRTRSSDWYADFVLMPGIDPSVKNGEIILAYDLVRWDVRRGSWAPWLIPQKTRCVLFADGLVRGLGLSEFQSALKKDAEARRELEKETGAGTAQPQPVG